VNLFDGVYQRSQFPESFNSTLTAATSLFVLTSTENYPAVMWPAFEKYSYLAFIFFASFICLGGIILATILGVIFNTYRHRIVRQAFRNYQKDRIGLVAAFSLLESCPLSHEGHRCSSFPCKHGDGIITYSSWRKLFLMFSQHGSSSYVRKVFNRNVGLLGLKIKSPLEDLSPFIQDQVNNVLLPNFLKVIKDSKLKEKLQINAWAAKAPKASAVAALEPVATGISSSRPHPSMMRSGRRAVTAMSAPLGKRQSVLFDDVGIAKSSVKGRVNFMSLDLDGFFTLADKCRSKLEVSLDIPLMKAKRQWLKLLEQLAGKDSRKSGKALFTIPGRLVSPVPRRQNIVQRIDNFISDVWSRIWFLIFYFKVSDRNERDAYVSYFKFARSFKSENRQRLNSFLWEFNKLALRDRKRMRKYMQMKIKIYARESYENVSDMDEDELKKVQYTIQILTAFSAPSKSEKIISRNRFAYTVHALVFTFFIWQVVLANPSIVKSLWSKYVDIFLLSLFGFEMLWRLNTFGISYFRRWNQLLSFSLVLISCLAHIVLGADSEYEVTSRIDWRVRGLRSLCALPMLRIFISIYEIMVSKFELPKSNDETDPDKSSKFWNSKLDQGKSFLSLNEASSMNFGSVMDAEDNDVNFSMSRSQRSTAGEISSLAELLQVHESSSELKDEKTSSRQSSQKSLHDPSESCSGGELTAVQSVGLPKKSSRKSSAFSVIVEGVNDEKTIISAGISRASRKKIPAVSADLVSHATGEEKGSFRKPSGKLFLGEEPIREEESPSKAENESERLNKLALKLGKKRAKAKHDLNGGIEDQSSKMLTDKPLNDTEKVQESDEADVKNGAIPAEESEMLERLMFLKNLTYNLLRILATLMVFTFAVFYFFAILGMEIFACVGIQADPKIANAYTHFDDLLGSFYALFQVATTSNWHDIMYATVRKTSLWAVYYFLAFFGFVLLIILNVIQALFVEAFENMSKKLSTDKKREVFQKRTTFELYARYVS